MSFVMVRGKKLFDQRYTFFGSILLFIAQYSNIIQHHTNNDHEE